MRRILLALLVLLALPLAAQVEVTYLANEGVMLRGGGAAVLIDALHGPYKSYAAAPANVRAAMERADAPYRVDLVLVSHIHADHFDAAMVANHLKNNGAARLISSRQVTDAVLAQLPAALANRVRAVTPRAGESILAHSSPNLNVRILGLPHGGPQRSAIQNLGHLIEIGGVKVLHIGDADVDPALFANFALPAETIDLALIPEWYLAYEEGQKLVREQIRPLRIAAVHMSGEKDFPGVTVLTKVGTRLTIPKAAPAAPAKAAPSPR